MNALLKSRIAWTDAAFVHAFIQQKIVAVLKAERDIIACCKRAAELTAPLNQGGSAQ